MRHKISFLVDVLISSERSIIPNEAENELKYKNLSIEIQPMRKMKCFVIPVITGTTGIVTEGLKIIRKQYQESIQ
jgi:hypothetical protein